MNKLEKLIYEYCPDGVEYRLLGEVLKSNNAAIKVSKNKYSDNGKYPIIDQSRAKIAGYSDNENGIPKDIPCIIFGDHTRTVKYIDFEFVQGDSGTRVFSLRNNNYNMKYIYYAFTNLYIESRGYNRHWSIAKLLRIPIPPIIIQEEIVRILDVFTEITNDITSELESEITFRKEEYKYYLERLLHNNGKRTKLNEIGKITMCRRIMKNQTSIRGDIPFYKIGTFGQEADAFITNELYEKYKRKFSHPKKGDVLISVAGTIGKCLVYDGSPAYFQDSNIVWIKNDESRVLNKYLYYCYELKPWKVSGATAIARLYNYNLEVAEIHVPSISTQEKIINILDRFEELFSELSNELTYEIYLRKKQFEYYRNALFNFQEK